MRIRQDGPGACNRIYLVLSKYSAVDSGMGIGRKEKLHGYYEKAIVKITLQKAALGQKESHCTKYPCS
jgi:hypothetical protein